MHSSMITTLTLLFTILSCVSGRYDPTWASLDSRPMPQWYLDDKIGIFIHMGVFSVPSFHGEWFWNDWLTQKDPDVVAFVAQTEVPDFTYADYAPRLTYEFFNATDWVSLFAASGARYVVPTTKHHEGFCMWPSATSFNWNSAAVGPNRDVYGEIANATRKAGLRLGAYHSLFEWYNPLFLADQAANFTTRTFVDGKTMPELYDLIKTYRPELVWSDGDWVANDVTYWKSPEFLAWLANDSPVADTVVWNDRWGGDSLCHHGSYYTCADRYLPNSLVGHPWENAFTIDTQSWGFRRNAEFADYMTTAEVIATVIQTVALGGNALINVGPTKDGVINPIFADRLTGLGNWLSINGEAIYASRPYSSGQNDTASAVWYTFQPASGDVYAIALAWPASGILNLSFPIANPTKSVATLVGHSSGSPLNWTPLSGGKGMSITMPSIRPSDKLAATTAWTIRLQNVV
jgi:alpha-L-fucosidase